MLSYVLHHAEEDAETKMGARFMQSRLVELMFLDVLRHHLAALPTDATGWLSGLRDTHVGHSLSDIHADPAQRWTVESLAQRAGLSRSLLAERFRRLVGLAPMQYLGVWRLQVAAALLRQGDLSIAQAAARVGYSSEAAFNRAFKRRVGVTPAEWRARVGR